VINLLNNKIIKLGLAGIVLSVLYTYYTQNSIERKQTLIGQEHYKNVNISVNEEKYKFLSELFLGLFDSYTLDVKIDNVLLKVYYNDLGNCSINYDSNKNNIFKKHNIFGILSKKERVLKSLYLDEIFIKKYDIDVKLDDDVKRTYFSDGSNKLYFRIDESFMKCCFYGYENNKFNKLGCTFTPRVGFH